MIDIHCHILPGIDDGAKTMEESLAMAELAADGGTTIVFATPHINTSERYDATQISMRVDALQSEIDAKSIPMQIIRGAECYPSNSIIAALNSNAPITLGDGGRYILLDTPLTAIPIGFEQLIFDIQTLGITPILAHPERAKPIQENVQMLEEFVMRGMLIQSNASSVIGGHGELAQETAQTLIKHGWIHFIASDAHSIRHRRSKLKAASDYLRDMIGESKTDELFSGNGMKVLNGETVQSSPIAYCPPKKKSWFGQLFRKSGCLEAGCRS